MGRGEDRRLGGWMLMVFAGCCACATSVFTCEDHAGCAGDEQGGFCEATGFCSFPDEGCPSGRRYGEFAGQGLGGACVGVPDTATSQAGPTGSSGLTTSLGSSSTGDPASGTGDPETGSASATTADNSSTAGDCVEGWWDCAWTVRQSVTLQAMPLDGPLTQIPFSARLDPGLLEDESLVLVTNDGVPVPWERDGTVAWVAVDAEPNSEVRLWAYGGNPAGPPDTSLGSVWDDDFVAVWHLSDGVDASSLGNDATPDGVVPEDGWFASATRFDGVDDRFDVPATDALAGLRDTGMTAELWLRPELAAQETYKRILDKTDATSSTLGWGILLVRTMPLGQLQVDLGHEFGEAQAISGDFDASEWVHVVVTLETDGTVGFFANGVPLESSQTPGVGEPLSDAEQPASIGSLPGDAASVRFFDGLMDELRLSRGVRSQDWNLATYSSGLPEAVQLGRLEALGVE